MRYRHVMWDWNGTLLDDAHICVSVLNGLLSRRGLATLELSDYRDRFDFPVQEFYARLGVDFTKESFDIIGDEYHAGYTSRLNECGLREGARELVDALTTAGYSQSVLSAYQQNKLEESIHYYGLDGVFVRLVGLDDYSAHSKVHKGKWWINLLPYEADEVLFVGDTRHDHEVAQAMGVDCVLLTCGHQSPRQLTSCGGMMMDDLAVLKDYLLG